MHRFVRSAMAAISLATAGTVATPQPAGAHVDACAVVWGAMEIFGRLGQYGMFENKDLTYEMHLRELDNNGGCLATEGWSVTGRIQGNCMSAYISGTTGDGHSFTGQWLGTQWILTGRITGSLTVYEVPLYPLCISGAAWAFEVHGALTKNHLT
jgi:hypothetical protein